MLVTLEGEVRGVREVKRKDGTRVLDKEKRPLTEYRLEQKTDGPTLTVFVVSGKEVSRKVGEKSTIRARVFQSKDNLGKYRIKVWEV